MAESNQQPPLCPCGFFGSPTTAGLCSKCYKAKLQKEELEKAEANSAPVIGVINEHTSTHSLLASNPTDRVTPVDTSNGKPGVDVVVQDCDNASAAVAETVPEQPVQKNKKRCFKCNQRLELAFTEIGRCKCDYVFCELHRLPEQHDCVYDHKEKGRKEALEKMISPKKHIGTSLRRLDSDT